MRSSVAAIAAVLALSAPALTPAVALAAPAAKSDAAPSIDTMKRLVKELSSDAYEGRAPGTVGEEKTLALLTAEFEKLGLKPGNKGSWFQDVPLVEITATEKSRDLTKSDVTRPNEQHEAVTEAFRRRDADAATAAMRAQMEKARNDLVGARSR